MQNKSRLSFINSKKLGRSIFSSYDNDTFVPDQEFDIGKRKASSLGDIIAEKDDEELKECTCTNDSNHETGTIILSKENGCSEHHQTSAHIHKDNTTSEANVNDTHKASNFESKSDSVLEKDGCPNPTPEAIATETSEEINRKKEKITLRKPRSFSDTQDPILCHHLSTTFEMNEAKNEKICKTEEESSSHSITRDDSVFDEDESKEVAQGAAAEPDKSKRNRRWMRKLARYATFDEGSVYLAKASKSPLNSSLNETLNQAAEGNDNNSSDAENVTKDTAFQRKISTGKFIKQSMSNGFSKFKQLSISGKNGSRKIEQEYSMINNDVYCHETSKRMVPIDTSEIMPTLFNVSSTTEASNMLPLPGNLLRRCSSLPDFHDTSSICDEELDELYLPRRMAICPDLAVPAMKQLRTYLVLTRLKQYCIV